MPMSKATLQTRITAKVAATGALAGLDTSTWDQIVGAIAEAVVEEIQTLGVVAVVTACPAGAGTGTGTVT